MNTRSLQVRLVFWYTVLTLIASCGFGVYTYWSFEDRLYQEMQMTLGRRIDFLGRVLLPGLPSLAPDVIARKMEEIYSPEKNQRFIRISMLDGNILYVSGVSDEGSLNPSRVPLLTDYTTTVTERLKNLRYSDHMMVVGGIFQISGKDYVLETGATTKPITSSLQKLANTLLIGLPVVMLLTVIGGLVLVRRALEPVEAIRVTAEQITFNNLRQRLPVVVSGDAIENLSKTLNQMLERLDQAYQQASRFSADASHELRTPLAIMRSELESIVHEQNVGVVLKERLGSILEEVERLSGIVEGLFAVARLDAGEAKIGQDVFDLAALSRSTFEQMQLLADEKRLSVTVDATQPVYIRGDTARLKQVIVNLFDNAVKYTLPGGAIVVSVQAKNSTAVLSVKDNGIGIPAESLPHVFERFYRADKVRTREQQGAGLGLAIVRAICKAHGGVASIQSDEGNGTVASVELPLADVLVHPKTSAAT